MGGNSVSINYLLILLSTPLLNSSTNSLSLYLLSLVTCLNNWIYSSMVCWSCSNCFNYTTFLDFLSFPPNFSFISFKNCSTVLKSNTPVSKYSKIFFFQIYTEPLCIYINTHFTCSYTIIFLIIIFKYNLHAVINSPTLTAFLLDRDSLIISAWNPLLGFSLAFLSSTLNSFYILTTCLFLCCSKINICSIELCWLRFKLSMRARLVLALLSNLNSFKGISISTSRPSSSPTLYYLLILLPWSNCYTKIPKKRISKLDISL